MNTLEQNIAELRGAVRQELSDALEMARAYSLTHKQVAIRNQGAAAAYRRVLELLAALENGENI